MGTETGIRGYGTYRDSSRYGALRERDPRQQGDLKRSRKLGLQYHGGLDINHFGIQYYYSTLRLKVDR